MKQKTIITTIIFIFIFLISIINVNAGNDYTINNVLWKANESFIPNAQNGYAVGMVIVPKVNFTLVSFNTTSSSTSTFCAIFDNATKTSVKNASWSSYSCVLNVNLTTDKVYLTYSNAVGAHNVALKPTYTGLPMVSSSFFRVTNDFYRQESSSTYNFATGSIYELDSIEVFNYTTEPTIINNIIQISQNPANITSTTLFNQNVNITYNYTNQTTSLTNIVFNYSISGNINCTKILNGTCIQTNNTYQTLNYTNNITIGDSIIVTRELIENDLYPYNNLLSGTTYNTPHQTYTLGVGDLYKTKFTGIDKNLSAFYYFETMTNMTSGSQAEIYICNSSYTTGAITTNTNCQEIFIFNNTGYNHTHGTYSQHNLIPFSIINGKINTNGISATETMYFIIRRLSGTVYNHYITNTTTSTTTETSLNSGVTWNTQTYTADQHLHMYPTTNTLYFNYRAIGTFNGTQQSTTIINELIDTIPFTPNPPTLINPFDNSNQTTERMIINYTNASANYPSGTINYYYINLLNNDTTYNRTITTNNGKNNTYNWNVYNETLQLTNYYIQVCAVDSINQTSCEQEQFDLQRNALLNITAYDSQTQASIGNINLNITNLNTNTIEQWNTNTGNIGIDIIKNTPYNIIFDTQNYAYTNINYTSNTSNYQKINQSLAKTNSITFNFYDEASGTLIINISCNVTLQGTSTSTPYNTTIGTIFTSNLTADTYTATAICDLYAQRQYNLIVTDRSTQTLNIYLIQSSNNVLFSYTDKDTGVVLEGVLVGLSKMINGTLTLVESRQTDITGRTQFNVATNTLYVFTSEKTNYESKTFTLNPVIFTSYSVQLKKINTISEPLDYENIAVTYNPQTFIIGNNTFTITISNPTGELVNYGYTLTSTCNTTSGNGINAYGGTFRTNFTLNNNCITHFDKLILTYYYETSNGQIRNFTEYLGITTQGQPNYTNNMQTTLAGGTYGMGSFERVLITTIITLVLVGVVASIGGMVGGLFVGLLIMGYFVSTGFIPLILVIITLFAGFVLVVSLNKR